MFFYFIYLLPVCLLVFLSVYFGDTWLFFNASLSPACLLVCLFICLLSIDCFYLSPCLFVCCLFVCPLPVCFFTCLSVPFLTVFLFTCLHSVCLCRFPVSCLFASFVCLPVSCLSVGVLLFVHSSDQPPISCPPPAYVIQ
jgi:hypothetical protein